MFVPRSIQLPTTCVHTCMWMDVTCGYICAPLCFFLDLNLPCAAVNGLFLEAGGWDFDQHALCDSKPREVTTPLPTTLFLPAETKSIPSVSTCTRACMQAHASQHCLKQTWSQRRSCAAECLPLLAVHALHEQVSGGSDQIRSGKQGAQRVVLCAYRHALLTDHSVCATHCVGMCDANRKGATRTLQKPCSPRHAAVSSAG